MRRSTIVLVFWLVLGAAINLSIAWGCVLCNVQFGLSDVTSIHASSIVLGTNGQPTFVDFRAQRELSAGLPWRSLSLRASTTVVPGPTPLPALPTLAGLNALPFRPVWPGFAANTLCYAAILWLIFSGRLSLRRLLRSKRGLCPECAYPRGHSALCPECGRAYAQGAVT